MTNIENNNTMNEIVDTNNTALTTTLTVPELPSHFNPPALQSQANSNPIAQLLQFPEYPDADKLPDGKLIPLNTMGNLQALLEFLGINYTYDVILKKAVLTIKDLKEDTDDLLNSQFAYIKSQCVIYGLSSSVVDTYLSAIIDQSSCNPLMDMVKSEEWDGIDRITPLCECLVTNDADWYKHHVVAMWLTQCVAAWDYLENCPNLDALPRFEGVLTLVGDQGVTKTKFFERLLPSEYRKYILTGIQLDLNNKDSVKISLCCGIGELGEIGATLSRGMDPFKAHLSKPNDKMRLPYARNEVEFKRRTSYGASVNNVDFLPDRTGNRRFFPVELQDILEEEMKAIDKHQLFAQIYHEYINGEKWWIDRKIDKEVYDYLNKKHQEHLTLSAEDEIVEKVIYNTLNSESNPLFRLEWKSATDIARYYNLPLRGRKIISTIKKELIKANIEKKGSNFLVFLMDETIRTPAPISK